MDENIRKIPRGKLLGAFLLATVIFCLVFIVSSTVSYYNYQRTTEQINEIYSSLEELENLAKRNDCTSGSFDASSKILDEIGGKLNLLEKRFGKNDARVLEQKNLYVKAELIHHNMVKSYREKCNMNFVTILYFYSNEENLREESERLSLILDALKRKSSDKIMIYSLDFNLDNNEIENLKQEFNITSAPIIVINEKEIKNPSNIDELNAYI